MSNDGELAALEVRLRDELTALAYPNVDWVRPAMGPDGRTALNCAVIGAGQAGMTIAAGLKRERVGGVVLFDRAPAGREGPWLTFARMQTLRTPKELTGPDLGLPSLGFRAWWIAQHGRAAWESMSRIPRTAWMEYLVWYRSVMDLDVRNDHALRAIVPVAGDMMRLDFTTPEGSRSAHARCVVLATGSEGGGGHAVPEFIAGAVPE
ncbi:MAG: FAD/NAD(P)-binding protein, partial [Alphaproteobacteria bacterium]|nr:FAD/NAD(P)-binding protein [Alphaproteobacteria bacterium]